MNAITAMPPDRDVPYVKLAVVAEAPVLFSPAIGTFNAPPPPLLSSAYPVPAAIVVPPPSDITPAAIQSVAVGVTLDDVGVVVAERLDPVCTSSGDAVAAPLSSTISMRRKPVDPENVAVIVFGAFVAFGK